MHLTTVQKIGLTIAVLGFLATAGTQLTDIFAPLGSIAPVIVKEIVSISGFGSGVLGIILAFITGQASAIKTVAAMPDVAAVVINRSAEDGTRAAATDPDQPKVMLTTAPITAAIASSPSTPPKGT